MEFWIFVGVGIVALCLFAWTLTRLIGRGRGVKVVKRTNEASVLSPKFQNCFTVHGENASLTVHAPSGEVAVVPSKGEAFVLPISALTDMRKTETSEDRTLPGFVNTNEGRYIKRIDLLIKVADPRIESVIVPVYTKGSHGRDLEKGLALARQEAAAMQAEIYQALSGEEQAYAA